MELQTALSLVKNGVLQHNSKQVWADLGAGNGLFTNALSTVLSDDSVIYAVDTDALALNSISIPRSVTIKKIQADFTQGVWNAEPLNGILMANALHFVKDKELFLHNLKEKLIPGGRLIIVEYEMENGNTWVPYPISFNRLSELVKRSGFSAVKKLGEVPSVYENRMIYSVVVE